MNDRPLKVALFSDSYYPVLNGVSVSIGSLAEELRALGHSVHIYTSNHSRQRDEDPNIHRFISREFWFAPDYPLAVPPFFIHLKGFRSVEFDVVHTHTPWTVGFVGLRWAHSHDLPIVSTYHTLYDRYAHHVPLLPRRYIRFKIAKHTNYYYNRVNHVITPSELAKRWLRRHSVKTPITSIPSAPLTIQHTDRNVARQQHGARPDEFILLYVGRIDREKNLETLLRAAKMVFSEFANTRLWLVGDGHYRSEVKQMVNALGIGDRVRFFGAVPRKDIDSYYAAADLFVFPSYSETQGLVVREAISHGLPVVLIQGGGASESITHGETGYLVRNDPAAFAEGINTVIQDEQLLTTLTMEGLKQARNWTPRAVAQQVEAVYRSVLNESPPSNLEVVPSRVAA
ncbi:MAG: glycosyltransferase [Fimbriimonadaceae bacterium]